ncbi:MAG: cyanophycin synthetase, partial [Mariprofundales bacterium]|nr:cyanophycin synthetase [Mariprofundales bacterium]
DSYHANPASMQAALDTLRALPPRRIAILGDMGELGGDSLAAHRRIALDGVDHALLIGEEMAAVERVDGRHLWFASLDEAEGAIIELAASLTSDDSVLVKGSRMMGLERVAVWLRGGEDAL